MSTIGEYTGEQPKMLEAVIVKIQSNSVIGKTSDGELVLFPLHANVEIGDTFSFFPEVPRKKSLGVKYVGKRSKLVKKSEPEGEFVQVEKTFAGRGLPDHHVKHFQRGEIVLGPRPCDLERQRITLSRVQTAQTSAS